MTAVGLEIELKLEAEPSDLESVLQAPVFADVTFSERAQHSTYFDTGDRALRAAGLSLRVRRTGDRRVQTTKAEGTSAAGLFARPEWEREILDDTPVLEAGEGPFASLLPELTPAALAPVFTVEVRRRSAVLLHEGGEVEVVIDLGEVTLGSRSEPIAEAELELRSGPSAALFSLARAMNAVAPMRLGVQTKSERGYSLDSKKRRNKAVKAESGVLRGEMTVAEAFARIAGACLRQFRLNEAVLARTGGADALHQARVSIRRLRSAFSIFKPVLEDDRYAHFRGELRWLAATLGEVRDIDVLLARFDGSAHVEKLTAERARAYSDVSAALASQRVRTLMIDLAEWVAIGGWRERTTNAKLRERAGDRFAADALDRLRRQIKRRGADLATLSDDERHEVRKLAKKLRYASEFFSGLFTGKKDVVRASRFIDAIADLQEELGGLNDLAHGSHVLAQLGIEVEPEEDAAGRRDALITRAANAQLALADARKFWR